MADFAANLLDPLAEVGMSQTAGYWVSMGINFIVYTLVGAVMLIILLKVLGSIWGEEYDLGRAFIVALVINVINLPLLGFLRSALSFMPLPVFWAAVWIALVRLFFGQMGWKKSAIAGLAGFALTIFIAPMLAGYIIGMLSPVLPAGF